MLLFLYHPSRRRSSRVHHGTARREVFHAAVPQARPSRPTPSLSSFLHELFPFPTAAPFPSPPPLLHEGVCVVGGLTGRGVSSYCCWDALSHTHTPTHIYERSDQQSSSSLHHPSTPPPFSPVHTERGEGRPMCGVARRPKRTSRRRRLGCPQSIYGGTPLLPRSSPSYCTPHTRTSTSLSPRTQPASPPPPYLSSSSRSTFDAVAVPRRRRGSQRAEVEREGEERRSHHAGRGRRNEKPKKKRENSMRSGVGGGGERGGDDTGGGRGACVGHGMGRAVPRDSGRMQRQRAAGQAYETRRWRPWIAWRGGGGRRGGRAEESDGAGDLHKWKGKPIKEEKKKWRKQSRGGGRTSPSPFRAATTRTRAHTHTRKRKSQTQTHKRARADGQANNQTAEGRKRRQENTKKKEADIHTSTQAPTHTRHPQPPGKREQ